MKTLNNLLDLAKELNDIPSDRQLGLSLGTGNLTRYRKGNEAPNDVTAIRLADLCSMKHEVVIAVCHAAKAETREERNVWQHIYKMASAACLVLVLCASLFTPNYAQASGLKSFLSCSIYYPLCDVIQNIRASLLFGYFPATTTKNKPSCVRYVM